jgi:AcrR family transcriptional regulator
MSEQRQLRADAQRNRDKLLATARSLFAEHGLGAPLDEIAKRAGVGSGTLYRHFPTRDDLIAAVFVEQLDENVNLLGRARQDEDPWAGLADYIRGTCRALATDRGLAELFAMGGPSPELRAPNSRAYDGMTALTERAKASGALRADFTPEDIIILLEAIAGIIRQSGAAASAATERFVSLALDGFRTEGATPAPPPISRGQIRAGRRDSRARSTNARAPSRAL